MTKMANLVKNGQRIERGYFGKNGKSGEHPPKSLSKNSNDMAKGSFECGDFDKNDEYGKIYQSLNYLSNKMAKGPLEKWRC